jgi:uncharacterized protein YjbI with pentapeptide repeats
VFAGESFFQGRFFENLVPDGTDWTDLEFEECRFQSVRLPEVRWSGLTLLDCTFMDCDLSNLHPLNCRIRNCRFVDCKLLGIDWTTGTALDGVTFQGCRLDYGNFSYLDLRHGKWLECSAREVHLVGTDLSQGDFSGTSFLGSTFSGTNLSHADLREASDYAVNPTGNTLHKTRVSLPEAVNLLRGLDILLEE